MKYTRDNGLADRRKAADDARKTQLETFRQARAAAATPEAAARMAEALEARVTAGNTVLPAITPTFLHNQVLCLTSDLGHVADRIIRATADNRITKAENRGILKEVLDLVEAATALAAALRDHDKKVGRHA